MNPGMFNEVSGALYRIGHTMVSAHIMRMNADGSVPMAGSFLFKEAFFQPTAVNESEVVDRVLKGVSSKPMQEIDPFVVSDLRNFLFAEQGVGGLDLIAINLQRGRDHGLPTLNQAREALGLQAHASFEEITSLPGIAEALASVYSNVNEVELWIGAMAEEHVGIASVGETLATALAMQFEHLRDGDRFFFMHDEALSADEKAQIRSTTLADVIRRNTMMADIQDAVFHVPPSSEWMDSDHDGQPDLREVVAGTDPNNPLKGLWAESLELNDDGSQTVMRWRSVPGKRYRVEYAEDLTEGAEWTALEVVLATSEQTAWQGNATAVRKGFYRVVLSE